LRKLKQKPPLPQYVPMDVAFAVCAMWGSLLLSTGFALYELISSASILDPMLRILIFLGDFLTIRALPMKRPWARYSAVLLALIFYAFLALDADGLTRTDLWHMLAKFPIDVFVITRLFKFSTTKWLSEP
jgi:hypothetical protein